MTVASVASTLFGSAEKPSREKGKNKWEKWPRHLRAYPLARARVRDGREEVYFQRMRDFSRFNILNAFSWVAYAVPNNTHNTPIIHS